MGALMARKDVLKGLLAEAGARTPSPASPPDRPEPATPRYAKGAIGAVGRSIADLKARALVEIDPHLIDAGGLQDRLESDPEEDAALARSIAEYGQQVPVLVRPHPSSPGRYQIVYGRRRVLALRELGLPVKSLVRELDDRDMVLAQGQENTARRDLSFVEMANFARQMTEAGYDRKVVCDALSIDKTVISRMLSVAERVPAEVIAHIGAAPGVGRDRWLALSALVEAREEDPGTMIAVITRNAAADTSNARFEALFVYLSGAAQKAPAAPAEPPIALKSIEGLRFGEAVRHRDGVTLRFKRSRARGFEDWLIDNIPEIHRRWKDGAGE